MGLNNEVAGNMRTCTVSKFKRISAAEVLAEAPACGASMCHATAIMRILPIKSMLEMLASTCERTATTKHDDRSRFIMHEPCPT